jgi:hypothetical protein
MKEIVITFLSNPFNYLKFSINKEHKTDEKILYK